MGEARSQKTFPVMQTLDGRSARVGVSIGTTVEVWPLVGQWIPGKDFETFAVIQGRDVILRFSIGAKRGHWVRIHLLGARVDGEDEATMPELDGLQRYL